MTVYVIIRTGGIVKRDEIVCIKSDITSANKELENLRHLDYSSDTYRIEAHTVEFKEKTKVLK